MLGHQIVSTTVVLTKVGNKLVCIYCCLPPGAGLIMASKLSVLLLLLAVATVTVLAQRRRPASTTTDEWNYRDGCEHPDYSLFTLGQRSSSGLIMMMSKLEVKDHAAFRANLYECVFVFIQTLRIPLRIRICLRRLMWGNRKDADL